MVRGATAETATAPGPKAPRRCYTLTHNDLTGSLALCIADAPNEAQMASFGSALLRDAVWGEWRHQVTAAPAAANESPPPFDARRTLSGATRVHAMAATVLPAVTSATSLHLHCTVADASAWWLPPATLRRWIFAKEFPLVLDAIALAEKPLLRANPHLGRCPIYVHFRYAHGETRVEYYGTLNKRQRLAEIVPPWHASWRYGGVERGWDNEVVLTSAPAAAPPSPPPPPSTPPPPVESVETAVLAGAPPPGAPRAVHR